MKYDELNSWIPTSTSNLPDISEIDDTGIFNACDLRDKLANEIKEASKFSKKDKEELINSIILQMIHELLEGRNTDITIKDVFESTKSLILLKYGSEFNRKYKEYKESIVQSRIDTITTKYLEHNKNRYKNLFKAKPDYSNIALNFCFIIFMAIGFYFTALYTQNIFTDVAPHKMQIISSISSTPQAKQLVIQRYRQIWPSGN